jgi:hypothetical protein
MDTRFWGPSGWYLFHLIAASPNIHVSAVKEWFSLMEFVLPCKYCRESFHEYFAQQPLTDEILRDRDTFSRWMYDIHNRVNEKLRRQKLLHSPNPSWPSVRSKYYSAQADLCKSDKPFIGWDFLTSIAFASDSDSGQDSTVLQRWWSLIPDVLPCKAWQNAWKTVATDFGSIPILEGKRRVMEWMWRAETAVCSKLKCPTPHPSRPVMEHEVSAFESSCGSKTCRMRKKRVKTQRRRQRKMRIRV